MGRRSLFLVTGILLAAASLAGAAADLSGSTITTEPAAPIERDEVVCRLRLSNRGDADAVPTFLRLRLPRTGFFVDASGADDLAFEAADRVLTGSVELPAGATREVEIRLVVADGSAGDSLAASLQMNAFAAGIEKWIHSTVPIDARANTSGVVGPVRVTEAGLAVLAFLVGYAVLLVAFRGRGARPLFALVAVAGFLADFGAMAALDWRTLEEWPESACTILDRRTSRAEKGSDARLQIETLALRYAVEGRTRVSTGLDTGMQRLPTFDVREGDPFPVGATVPCWTDPDDPARVIVRRGFGAAYLFALFPLPVLAWGWFLLRARLG